MQLSSPEEWILFLCNSFQSGFTFFCIICLAGRMIRCEKIQQEFINIHTAVNLSLALGSVLAVLSLAIEFYRAYKESSVYEGYADMQTTSVIFSIITIAAGWVLGLLFFMQRLRSSWVLSAVVLILWNCTLILSWVTGLYKDYRPAAWSADNNFIFVGIGVLLFAGITVLLYRLLAKRKKLPYTSSWI